MERRRRDSSHELRTPETILIDRVSQEMLQQAIAEMAVPYRNVAAAEAKKFLTGNRGGFGYSGWNVMSRLSRARRMVRDAVQEKLGRSAP